MAAGLVYHALTASVGVTFDVAQWVPDTGAPDDNAVPVHISFDTTGAEVWTAAKITTMLGYLDNVETKLDTIHTDLDTTLKGYLDGLEGYVDGLETLIGSTNTALAAATPAGTNLIGKVSASHETSTLYNGTTALTPKFKKIDCNSSGNNEIVAAVTGKKIRVLAWDVSPSDVVNFKWRTASTDITGPYYAANAGNGVSKPYSPIGYFETASDEALNLNLSAAEAVGGSLVYVEV